MTRPMDVRDVRSSGDYPEINSMFERLKAARAEAGSARTSDLETLLGLRAGALREGHGHDSTAEVDEANSLYAGSTPGSPIVSTSGRDDETNSLYVRTPVASPPPRSPVVVVSPQRSPLPDSPSPRSHKPAASPLEAQNASSPDMCRRQDQDGVTLDTANKPGPLQGVDASDDSAITPLEQTLSTEQQKASTHKRKAVEMEDDVGHEGKSIAGMHDASEGKPTV